MVVQADSLNLGPQASVVTSRVTYDLMIFDPPHGAKHAANDTEGWMSDKFKRMVEVSGLSAWLLSSKSDEGKPK